MRKIFPVYLMLLTLLASSSAFAAKKAKTNSAVEQNLSSFHAVVIKGNGIKLTLIGQQKRERARILKSANQLRLEVKDGVLWILSEVKSDHSSLPAKVTVWAKRLQSIHIEGNNQVHVSKLGKTPLTVVDAGNGNVRLDGVVNLRHLYHEGSGDVSVHWVNSPNLNIYSTGSGVIKLAGTVNVLHARLYGRSQLNAPYLRARTAFVQTADQAAAKVLPLKTFNAFAFDHSNIYYFKAPKHLVASTRAYGNVLQLHYWN